MNGRRSVFAAVLIAGGALVALPHQVLRLLPATPFAADGRSSGAEILMLAVAQATLGLAAAFALLRYAHGTRRRAMVLIAAFYGVVLALALEIRLAMTGVFAPERLAVLLGTAVLVPLLWYLWARRLSRPRRGGEPPGE